MRRAARAVAAGIVLAALSVFATWPAASHLGEFLAVGDPMVSAWGLWWTSESVLDLRNPWFTDAMLAPDGTYLSFHALVPLAGVLLAPVIKVVGAPLTLNLLKLALPVVAALTARYLARQAGLSGIAAWVAGGVFGFSTIVVWRTTFHLNFGFALALLPLAPAFAMRYGAEPRRRWALATGAAVAALVLSDPTIAIFGAMAVALFGLLAVLDDRGRWREWLSGAAYAGATTLILAAPQLWMMVRATREDSYDSDPATRAGSWTNANTNLETMLSPANVRDWVPGGLEHRWYVDPATVGEATPTYGWGALGLLLALVVCVAVPPLRRRVSGFALTRAAVIWSVVLLVLATVMALGPEVTLSDDPWVPLPVERYGQRLSGLMPYTWVTSLPFLADLRIPSRFTMLGMLPLALLAGAGAAALMRIGRLGVVVLAALVVFAVAESGFPDGGTAKQWTPSTRDWLYEPIRYDPGDAMVVDVPLSFSGGVAGAGRTPGAEEGMLYAIEHGHRIASGYMTRLTPHQVAARTGRRFFAAILARQDPPPPGAPIPPVRDAAAANDAKVMNAGWVVVWPAADRQILAFLRSSGFRLVRERDGIQIWGHPALVPVPAADRR